MTKPQMKTPYELLMGKKPNIKFMKPFGCALTILNTVDNLGKFDGKSDEGYLLGYCTNSKGFRVYNRATNSKGFKVILLSFVLVDSAYFTKLHQCFIINSFGVIQDC